MPPRKQKTDLTELDRRIAKQVDDEMSLEHREPLDAVGGAEITGQQLAQERTVYGAGTPEAEAQAAREARERDRAEQEAERQGE